MYTNNCQHQTKNARNTHCLECGHSFDGSNTILAEVWRRDRDSLINKIADLVRAGNEPCAPLSVLERFESENRELRESLTKARNEAATNKREKELLQHAVWYGKEGLGLQAGSRIMEANKELVKRVAMLEAERGPGIKHEPEEKLPCDVDWD